MAILLTYNQRQIWFLYFCISGKTFWYEKWWCLFSDHRSGFCRHKGFCRIAPVTAVPKPQTAPHPSLATIGFLQCLYWRWKNMAGIFQTTFHSSFLEFELLYFFFIKICSLGCYYQASIGSVNGLALNRWQAIIWTNDNQVCDTI